MVSTMPSPLSLIRLPLIRFRAAPSTTSMEEPAELVAVLPLMVLSEPVFSRPWSLARKSLLLTVLASTRNRTRRIPGFR